MKDQILQHLPQDFPWRESILWFDSIESTNTLAKALAADCAPQGTVLIADHQTGGRGRRGRSFHSPAGSGIYMSVILRPDCAPAALMHLTCAAAVAICDAVEKTAGIRPGIKWTNDLVCGKRKIAGILTELGLASDGKTDYAIVGIGINCCQKEADFPEEIRAIAGSLSSVTGKAIDRAALAAAMIQATHQMGQTLLTEKAETIARYRTDCVTLGKEVCAIKADGAARHGSALTIDEEGALVVRFDNGQIETVNSGEVSIRGMYGYL